MVHPLLKLKHVQLTHCVNKKFCRFAGMNIRRKRERRSPVIVKLMTSHHSVFMPLWNFELRPGDGEMSYKKAPELQCFAT